MTFPGFLQNLYTCLSWYFSRGWTNVRNTSVATVYKGGSLDSPVVGDAYHGTLERLQVVLQPAYRPSISGGGGAERNGRTPPQNFASVDAPETKDLVQTVSYLLSLTARRYAPAPQMAQFLTAQNKQIPKYGTKDEVTTRALLAAQGLKYTTTTALLQAPPPPPPLALATVRATTFPSRHNLPRHSLGVEVVSRLIQQNHVWLFKQESTQGHASLLSSRQLVHGRARWRNPKTLHRNVHPVLS